MITLITLNFLISIVIYGTSLYILDIDIEKNTTILNLQIISIFYQLILIIALT